MELTSIGQGSLVGVGIIGLKIFVSIMVILYLIYTLILSRRIRIMNQNLKTSYEKSFLRISRLHILGAIIAIVLAILSIIY